MAAQPPIASDLPVDKTELRPHRRVSRSRLLLSAVVLVAGVGIGATIGFIQERPSASVFRLSGPTPPSAIWPAGTRPAPDFRLVNQYGAPISLRSLRGQTAIVTFIDPVCRNLCPLEARVLSTAVRTLPPESRPAIVSASVNPWADTRTNFRADARHWQLDSNWRWAIGARTKLAAAWRKYQIAVQVVQKRVAGVTVREIAHSEVAYIVDRLGYERALFIYPFNAVDTEHALRKLDSSS